MSGTDSHGTPERHHHGHSCTAQQAIADARRCDEHNARQLVAVTRVRALLVELGRATQEGVRSPLVPWPATRVAEPIAAVADGLAPLEL